MPVSLPDLPYPHDALEPHVSRRTLEIHHGRHHRAYVDKVNELTRGTPLAGVPLEQIVSIAVADPDRSLLFNQAAQAWNHAFLWRCMTPGGGGPAVGEVAARIREDFGSYAGFASAFRSAASTQFGSGWAWLVLDHGRLAIAATSNADLPQVHDQVPLLTIDVWEHAYYLDYQNRRADYVDAFLENLTDWEFVNRTLGAAERATDSSASAATDAAGTTVRTQATS